jgi:hypothetical protein
MKIKRIDDTGIYFNNDSRIYYTHYQDCCERNYADFEQLDDLARNYEFEENLKFEIVEGAGFRFGDTRRMFFVPCYSEQNGYYSCDIDIYYAKKTPQSKKKRKVVKHIDFNCEFIDA